MPFTPIDPSIKSETVKLVQQNMSLTQIHNELQKRGRNVSRSWVANIAREYKKLLPRPQQELQQLSAGTPPALETGPGIAPTLGVGTPLAQASVPENGNGHTIENGLVQNPTKVGPSPGLPLAEARIRAEMATKIRSELEVQIRSELENKVRAELEVKVRAELENKVRAEQDQRDQQLAQRDTKLQQQIADHDKEAAAQLKAHQKKELLLNLRFKDLLIRERNVSRYGSVSIFIEEMGFVEEEILNFFSMVRNRAEVSGMSNRAVLAKIIQEFTDEEDVQSRLYNKNIELASANRNLIYKQLLMLS